MARFNETHFAQLVAESKRYVELNGQVEAPVRSPVGTVRIDILTATHAFECKFGSTAWKTAIGQALAYSHLAHRKAGIIVFIRTNPKFAERDQKGYELLKKTIEQSKLKIDLHKFHVNRNDGTISKYNNLEWAEQTEEPIEESKGFFGRLFS